MHHKKYSDEFKLQVVEEYYKGELGCRLLAQKYNLPSKNYIFNWRDYLISKGYLNQNLKPIHHKGSQKPLDSKKKTAYEIQLERENLELKARLALFGELEKLLNEDSQNNKKK